MVSPARRRDAVAYLQRRHKVSERRACNVVGQHRSTNRYEARPADLELRLVKRMNELAALHPRYGYRRIWALLREEGLVVNRKRIERLWRLEGHRVPPMRGKQGKRAEGSAAGALWSLPALEPDQVWAYDFVQTVTADGVSLRILNVVDEFTRRALVSHVARSIGAREVVRVLGELFDAHGRPEFIRSDNGREFISETTTEFLKAEGVVQVLIEKGSPQQNAFVERFNGTMRDELLNGEHFDTLLEARVQIEQWRTEYNTRRPHRGLGFKTPEAFDRESKVGST
jgi:putative transposase